jgi:hypothetical protein
MKSAGEAFGGSNPSLPTTDEAIPDDGIVSFNLVASGTAAFAAWGAFHFQGNVAQ